VLRFWTRESAERAAEAMQAGVDATGAHPGRFYCVEHEPPGFRVGPRKYAVVKYTEGLEEPPDTQEGQR
jgi:hypothetical protein